MAFKVMTLENLKRFAGNIKTWATDSFVAKETGKGLSEANYTNAEKTKLGTIAENAQVNVIETVKVNGAAQTVSDKAVNIDLSAYALKSDISSAVNWKGTKDKVSSLPTSGNTIGDLWHVDEKSSEYVWNGTTWEEVGSIVDLSAYSTTEQMNTAITTAVSPKADKTYVDTEVKKLDDAIKALDIPDEVIVDGTLSTTSTNAIQNKVVTTELNLKATKEELTEAQNALNTAIGKKANSSDVYLKTETYSKTEADALLGDKANSADVYLKTQTYSKTEVDTAVNAKADSTYVGEQLDLKVNVADMVAFTNDEIDSATA